MIMITYTKFAFVVRISLLVLSFLAAALLSDDVTTSSDDWTDIGVGSTWQSCGTAEAQSSRQSSAV